MNIDIATFNIDTDKAFAGLVKLKTEIEKLKNANKDLAKEYSATNKSVAENQKQYDSLKKELQGLANGSNAYKVKVAELQFAEENLNASLLEQNKINETYQTQLQKNNLEINKLSNESRGYQTILDAQNRASNESLDIYSRQRAELSLLQKEQREVGAVLLQMKNNGQENSQEFKELSATYDKASKKANELATELRGIDGAGGNLTSNIGNYKSAVEGFAGSFDALKSGDIKGAFDGIKESVSGLFKVFVANPIIGVIALLGVGIKKYFDYNNEIKENILLTEQLTGVTGKSADEIRNRATAFTKSFGGDLKDNLQTAKELVTDFGITYNEAFDLITDSTIRGANLNGDFADSIKEYGVFFANAGYSAQEFNKILSTGVDLGVYNDKLPDAIKEIDLSLREQTKATKEALIGAFGATFTNDVLSRVNSGATTTKEALAEISAEAEKSNLSQVQLATLTADIARGAGEDVGGIAKVFEAVNIAINKNQKPLTDLQKSILEVSKENDRLTISKDKALKSDAVIALQQEFSNAWKKIQIGFYETLTNVREFFTFLQTGEIKIKAAFNAIGDILPNIFKQSFEAIKRTFSNLIDTFLIGGSVITKALSGDFDGAKESFKNFKQSFSNIGSDIKKTASNISSQVSGVIAKSNNDVDKSLKSTQDKLLAQAKFEADLEKKQNEKVVNKGEDPNAKKLNDEAKKKQEKAQKELEDAQKKELDSLNKLNDEKIKKAQLELGIYIDKNKSILENEKYLTKALADEEKKRLINIQDKKDEVLKSEFDLQNGRLTASIKTLENKKSLTQTEKNELETLLLQQSELQQKYNNDLIKNDTERQKATTEIDKRYSNERIEAEKVRKAIEYQTQLLQLETQGASEAEIKNFQLENQNQIEVERLLEGMDAKFNAKIEKDAEQLTLQQEIDLIQEELQNEINLSKDENEKLRLQNKLDALNNIETTNNAKKKAIDEEALKTKLQAYSRLFGDIGALFGKETAAAKIAGVAQAGINTYLGATNALADKKLPYPLNIISAGTIIASGLQSVAKISGFSDGGFTGAGGKNDVAGLVHAGEIVFSQEDIRRLGGVDAVEGLRPTSNNFNGAVSGLTSVQNQITNNTIDAELMANIIGEKVMIGAMAGTESGSTKGIGKYNDSIEIINKSKF